MKKKIAIIFGVTGQDGFYLSKLLLKKNYIVHGVKRRSSSLNTSRIDHIYQDPHVKNRKFILQYGDVTDAISISKIIIVPQKKLHKVVMDDDIFHLSFQI